MIQKDLYLLTLQNNHVVSAQPLEVKRVGYQLNHIKPKLKAELIGLPQEQLTQLALTTGREAIPNPVYSSLISCLGDTPANQVN